MKKAIKFFTLLFALVLTVSAFAVFASAADCEGQEVNIAGEATVTGDTGPNSSAGVFWGVSDHYDNVNDGDYETACPCDIVHWRDCGIWLTFDDTHKFSRIIIKTYGVGRTETSKNIANHVSGKLTYYTLSVYLYNENGGEVYNGAFQTSKDDIVIEFDSDMPRAQKIYIFYANNGAGQAIWEVEAYTKEAHNWEDVNVVTPATCLSQGLKVVKCSECDERKDAVIPAKGHTDTCKGECDVCFEPIEVAHKGVSGCATVCIKCSAQIEGSGHKVDPDNPCSPDCYLCGEKNVVTPVHVPDGLNPCSNDCAKCGQKDIIPDAYDVAGETSYSDTIYRTDKFSQWTYAPHVANPNDPCSNVCYKCGEAETVRPAHTPGATTGTWAEQNNTTINPCSSKQCAECGLENAYPVAPHIIVDNPDGTVAPNNKTYYPCSRTCGKCWSYFAAWYSHNHESCGEACSYCGAGAGIAERDHTFTKDSPTICVDCGWLRSGFDCPGHVYDNSCDSMCNICKSSRYAGRDIAGGTLDPWHIYDNSCDTTCNGCGEERTITHTYKEFECATECTVCGYVRENATPHTYSNYKDINDNEIAGSYVCDPDCDVCGEKREITHSFPYACAPNCSICGTENKERDKLHVWDHSCDTTCNNMGCTETREKKHVFDNDCDTTCNNEGCDGTQEKKHSFGYDCQEVCGNEGCGYTRPVEHKFLSDCDPDCNKQQCTYVREVAPHKYDNGCDKFCNVFNCGFERNATKGDPNYDENYVVGHKYANDCDTTCDVCGVKRSVGDHVYDNLCDTACNICNTERATAHQFNNWTVTKPADKGVEGEQSRRCVICGLTETKTLTALPTGLGAGATTAIVVSSVAVAGGGGFCLWWFVLKKKFFKG